MSTFLGGVGTQRLISMAGVRAQNDDVHQREDYRFTYLQTRDGIPNPGGTDVLWTRARWGMFANGFQGLNNLTSCPPWEWNIDQRGHHHGRIISGTVRNAQGQAITGSSVTVWLFNTATGLRVDVQSSSAADGSYIVEDPNSVTSFVVGYLPDAPDTAGVTVDTL